MQTLSFYFKKILINQLSQLTHVYVKWVHTALLYNS